MNVSSSFRPLGSLTAQLGRLSVGLSRTSIRPASTVDQPLAVREVRETKKSKKKQSKPRIEPKFEPGHGEKIWIFGNFVNGMTVYSHSPVLKANKALRQIPFVSKKLKPSKIRKDYWLPMAMIQFPEGMGHIGRSVFHIMREFRMQHDLAWGDNMLQDDETNRMLTKHERGEKIYEHQKANAVADMAAVLGGLGKGNKMWLPVLQGAEDLVDTSGETRTDEQTGSTEGLLKTQIFWKNELDKNYAKAWPVNVSHSSFAESMSVPIGQAQEGLAPEELVAAEEPKKTSWFSRS
ncbi:transcriptional regulation of mitochondrial recombination-domain-containing protein [Truncatella angustata]|uniref:Large ribosomal subunit protein mL67 n=1 Tax=Truncatella angustata TaxID=152316 RepID=A0A9P8UL61_9PEZI|nr:transcriptional regulation of mitochondrial recombination-domain-containing protein [Truncatella angustata]KAH6654191.1 transcriptional regulation of mitochondrial recombination-domain-containing protein [Truncatella angustata]